MSKNITTIEDKNYQLHSVKVGTVKIGLVPVLAATTVQDILNSYPEDLIVSDWHKGAAVRLQAMARNCHSQDKLSKGDFGRIASTLLLEDAARYQGNFSLLETDVQAVYENEKDDIAANEDKVWAELL